MAYSTRILGAALPLVAFTACDFTQQETKSFDSDRALARIEVDVNVGDISVRGSSDGQVHVESLLTWAEGEPAYTVELVETSPSTPAVLKITARCESDERCMVQPQIQAPVDVEVVITGGRSNVDVQGTRGDLAIDTEYGEISVADLGGDLDLSTRTGNIEGRFLTSASVTAATSGTEGMIDLEFKGAPLGVDVETTSGDILVTVPQAEYLVDAASQSGVVSIAVIESTGVPNTITARSQSGDITIRPPCEGTTCA